MSGFDKVCDLPYGMSLMVDRGDGSPFIVRRGELTMFRPEEIRLRPEHEWRAVRETACEKLRRFDEEYGSIPMRFKRDWVAALNAAMAMNPDIKGRDRLAEAICSR